MAKKGKAKISRVKRNNQTTNKMKKQGKLKLQRHRQRVPKQGQQTEAVPQYSSDSESASGEEWADMLDDDEQKYIMSRLASEPKLLSSVPEKDSVEIKHPNKRKRGRDSAAKSKPDVSPDSGADIESANESEASDVEEKYEREQAERPVKKMRPLLPIKTKQGVFERTEECPESESETEDQATGTEPTVDTSEHDSDSGMSGTAEDEMPSEGGEGEVISAVQLMAQRRDTLSKEKFRIGALCSSLLETPERKLKNMFPILYLMEEYLKDGSANLLSVRKLATLSAYEVFKDILPEYLIRHQDYSNIKLKKDTLSLYKYEKELLEFYKRYLQRLEKATSVLRPKKGDTRKHDEATIGLALVSLRCLCGMLSAKPQFNYAVNIAQSVVPLLGGRPEARDVVSECCVTVFRDDKKGDITLTVVRLINQLVKRRGERLHPAALDCLLSLKIRNVQLDKETEIKAKKLMEEKKKKRIVNLSKKEKKRAKKLAEVERELLETEAQESTAARATQMTEVTKTVFHIYFRVLKTAPHSRLLTAVLNGLAKFTHVINLEFYSELVLILSRLISDELVGGRERALCVRTALAILAGCGDALNVDPMRFHAHLYENMLNSHAGASHDDVKIALESMMQVLSRSRSVSPAVLQACAKRLATLSLQLHHNGALACLQMLHKLEQQSKPVASLFTTSTEEAFGSGRYAALLPSPEHCNAHAASLHELVLLRRHYHPAVRETTHQLPTHLSKPSPLELFDQYDGSKLSFKPAIPPPKKASPKSSHSTHIWLQTDLKDMCLQIESRVGTEVNFTEVLNRKRVK